MHRLLVYSKLAVARAISGVRRSLVGLHVEALLVNGNGGIFLVDVEDMAVGAHLARNGEYGAAELARLLESLDEGHTLLIVGAHVGTLAVPASKHCRSVIAVEANPHTFELLKRNLLLNKCDNVSALNIAAGDKNENLQFVLSKANPGGSKRMPIVRDYAYFYDSPEIVSVEARPLDEVLEDTPIRSPYGYRGLGIFRARRHAAYSRAHVCADDGIRTASPQESGRGVRGSSSRIDYPAFLHDVRADARRHRTECRVRHGVAGHV